MEELLKVMVNGLPGDMATIFARHIRNDGQLYLIPWALTGPEVTQREVDIDGVKVELITPDNRESAIEKIKSSEGDFITVDYTQPDAVNGNAVFYCKHELPFVMGTTGGDRKQLIVTVEQSNIVAVIAPNMGMQIVGFMAFMEYASKTFPGLFAGFKLEIEESHQAGKVDTSGTAKAMVVYFNGLGVPFDVSQIVKVRDPKVQLEEWGIPEEYLEGHAYHRYTLTSSDGTVKFQFVHNVNGRDIYARGTIAAVLYLATKVEIRKHTRITSGQVFDMIDLLTVK